MPDGSQNLSKEAVKASVSMTTVHRRLALEFIKMAAICDSVEEAVSLTLQHVNNLEDLPIVKFQGLDRLRQNLEDFSRLALLLGEISDWGAAPEISEESLRQTLHLTETADMFTGHARERAQLRNEKTPDELWDQL